jgi:hypothetical protein
VISLIGVSALNAAFKCFATRANSPAVFFRAFSARNLVKASARLGCYGLRTLYLILAGV